MEVKNITGACINGIVQFTAHGHSGANRITGVGSHGLNGSVACVIQFQNITAIGEVEVIACNSKMTQCIVTGMQR